MCGISCLFVWFWCRYVFYDFGLWLFFENSLSCCVLLFVLFVLLCLCFGVFVGFLFPVGSCSLLVCFRYVFFASVVYEKKLFIFVARLGFFVVLLFSRFVVVGRSFWGIWVFLFVFRCVCGFW